MHSITGWNLARSPNYIINEDLLYHYSEVPYIGNYKLVKLPLPEQELLEHIDYWGEGRIIVKFGASGFGDCYNVNHQYQLVSNGPDKNRKIPNRIPVVSYTNCNTSSYVRDNSVILVTLMGAPINNSCAEDIARMVNDTVGKVVVYGFDSNSADIKNLERELQGKGIYYCPSYDLPNKLKTLTLYDSHRCYINQTELTDLLYKNVIDARYENAVNISKSLSKGGNTEVCDNIVKTVKRLLEERNKNLMNYAYKLWNSDAKDIVTNNFSVPFKQIFNNDSVKIINKKYMIALKLDSKDTDHGRIAYGDTKNETNDFWKLIPIWDEDKVFFKIQNIENDMLLKLDINKDGNGNRQAWGVKDSNEAIQWSVEPVKIDDDVLFFIINREYKEGLKLDVNIDSLGNRVLWSNSESAYDNPEYFGWFITPWK